MGVEKAPRRSLMSHAGIVLRGLCMGAADVVPGVSGGTMALITGIYEELIFSIRSFDLVALRLLFSGQWRTVLARVRWPFLGALLLGILTAIASLSKIIVYLLDHHPIFLWAFFFGLVLASVYAVGRRIPRWTMGMGVCAGVAALSAYVLVGLVPVQTPNTLPYVFGSAVIAICAMILPGISGSFMLVLMGKYNDILQAVNTWDFVTLGVFGAGAVVGLATFSRVLSWVFRRYHDLTIALLTGLMLGSLRRIWPWKETLSSMVDRHGKEVPLLQVNRLPEVWNAEVGAALLLAVFGLALVLVMEHMARRRTREEKKSGGIFA